MVLFFVVGMLFFGPNDGRRVFGFIQGALGLGFLVIFTRPSKPKFTFPPPPPPVVMMMGASPPPTYYAFNPAPFPVIAQQEGKVDVSIILELPPDIVWRPNSLEDVLWMCVNYGWNPVDIKFNYDVAHRNTVERKVAVCTDPMRPAIAYSLRVPPELAMDVTEFTRANWRELTNELRQWGVNRFLSDFRAQQATSKN